MIGASLKRLRLKHNYKQVYVSKKIGIANSVYCNMERGKYPLKVEHLEWFSTFYGLPSVEKTIANLFAGMK